MAFGLEVGNIQEQATPIAAPQTAQPETVPPRIVRPGIARPETERPETGRPEIAFISQLAAHGDRSALIDADRTVSYRELSQRVSAARESFGDQRRLILINAANTVSTLTAYLAALSAGNVVLLVPSGSTHGSQSLIDMYQPDVIVDESTSINEIRDVSAHELHPELALLLSTSGSTGSPKLVRLSHRNLQANAQAICDYLLIRESDRAVTTLPMAYCYGLSVIHSHLLAGAGLILTDLSVVDSCFWQLVRRQNATTFAGVPYTYDLLDRVGFADMDLPSLRYLTQAGGKLPAVRVREYAELGQRRGWDFVVMYGQTEATARMAHLPPDLAYSNPGSIGRPIPGGTFAIEPIDGLADGTGELVYRGENVMLGYAESPHDLRLGDTTEALRTGDIARRDAAGLYEIVGRRSRFAKLFGLRIDLDRVEGLLASDAGELACVVAGDKLVVATVGASRGCLKAAAAQVVGIPASGVEVLVLPHLPRLSSGKPDLRAIQTAAAELVANSPREADASLRAVFSEVLNVSKVSDGDSFVSLRGDSMSYIEMSIRLEELLGTLPSDWHTATIRHLGANGLPAPVQSTPTKSMLSKSVPAKSRLRLRAIETNVVLRAVAMVLVVGSHATIFNVRGGAHLLIAIAGYNFARFQLQHTDRYQRLAHMLTSIRRIVVPSMIWMAFALVISDEYSVNNLFFLHNLLGPEQEDPQWRYWFVEALLYVVLAAIALLAIPQLHRLELKWPFWFAVTLIGVGLLGRYNIFDFYSGPKAIYTPMFVFWLFAVGWAIAKAVHWWQRALISTLVLVATPGFSDNPTRVAVMIAGLMLLMYVPMVRMPTIIVRALAAVAGASLFIYLTHWQVLTLLETWPVAAFIASFGFGLLAWFSAPKLVAFASTAAARTRAFTSREAAARAAGVAAWVPRAPSLLRR